MTTPTPHQFRTTATGETIGQPPAPGPLGSTWWSKLTPGQHRTVIFGVVVGVLALMGLASRSNHPSTDVAAVAPSTTLVVTAPGEAFIADFGPSGKLVKGLVTGVTTQNGVVQISTSLYPKSTNRRVAEGLCNLAVMGGYDTRGRVEVLESAGGLMAGGTAIGDGSTGCTSLAAPPGSMTLTDLIDAHQGTLDQVFQPTPTTISRAPSATTAPISRVPSTTTAPPTYSSAAQDREMAPLRAELARLYALGAVTGDDMPVSHADSETALATFCSLNRGSLRPILTKAPSISSPPATYCAPPAGKYFLVCDGSQVSTTYPEVVLAGGGKTNACKS